MSARTTSLSLSLSLCTWMMHFLHLKKTFSWNKYWLITDAWNRIVSVLSLTHTSQVKVCSLFFQLWKFWVKLLHQLDAQNLSLFIIEVQPVGLTNDRSTPSSSSCRKKNLLSKLWCSTQQQPMQASRGATLIKVHLARKKIVKKNLQLRKTIL